MTMYEQVDIVIYECSIGRVLIDIHDVFFFFSIGLLALLSQRFCDLYPFFERFTQYVLFPLCAPDHLTKLLVLDIIAA